MIWPGAPQQMRCRQFTPAIMAQMKSCRRFKPHILSVTPGLLMERHYLHCPFMTNLNDAWGCLQGPLLLLPTAAAVGLQAHLINHHMHGPPYARSLHPDCRLQSESTPFAQRHGRSGCRHCWAQVMLLFDAAAAAPSLRQCLPVAQLPALHAAARIPPGKHTCSCATAAGLTPTAHAQCMLPSQSWRQLPAQVRAVAAG